MEYDLSMMHGYCIVKQSNLLVIVTSYLNFKFHGITFTFKLGQLISVDHFEEGESIDNPLVYKTAKYADDKDSNGNKRIIKKFIGYFKYAKPAA